MRPGDLIIIVTHGSGKGDALSERFNNLVMLLRRLVRLTEIKVRIRVIGLEPAGFFQQTDRLFQASFLQVNDPKIIIGEVIVLVYSQRDLEFFGGVIEPRGSVFKQVSQSQVVMGAGGFWIERDGFFELFYRLS